MSKPEFYACCPDCYNSHGDCVDGGECPCHKDRPELRSAANWAATGGWPTGYRHNPATYVEGREAPMEACEMPASSGGAAWAATVEACARAACEAHPSDPEWAISTDAEREMWRKVARAVLAAAGRGVR